MTEYRRKTKRSKARSILTSGKFEIALLIVILILVGILIKLSLEKDPPKEPAGSPTSEPTQKIVSNDTPVPVSPTEAAPTAEPASPTPTPTPTVYVYGLCESVTTDTTATPVPGDNWKVDYLMLVNWNYRLKYTGNPENLVRIDEILTADWYTIENPYTVSEKNRNFVIENEEDRYSRGNREVLIHLDEMCRGYHEATGHGVKISQTGGYRNYATQDRFWNNRDRSINPPRTIPGNASEHRTGLGFDIWVLDGEKYNYDWFRAHCHEYGFILRYPENKSKITGITNEQWHYRYVGVEAATEMTNLGMCLEEYVAYKIGTELEKPNMTELTPTPVPTATPTPTATPVPTKTVTEVPKEPTQAPTGEVTTTPTGSVTPTGEPDDDWGGSGGSGQGN